MVNNINIVSASYHIPYSVSVNFIYIYVYKSIIKTDITLLTKVHLVKAMTFPVVMYGCESLTIKS